MNREDRFRRAKRALTRNGFNPSGLIGIRFNAAREDGSKIRVELRTRAYIKRENMHADLHICFPIRDEWYLIPHDQLVKIAGQTTNWLETPSWRDRGFYHSNSLNRATLHLLEEFRLGSTGERGSRPSNLRCTPVRDTVHKQIRADCTNGGPQDCRVLRSLNIQRVSFDDLNARQKEIYNFQKLSALLADFGFNCIKLTDDWQGTDFLAYHKDEEVTLKVQLKGGLSIDKKYMGKNLYVSFPVGTSDGRIWYLVSHDELVAIMGRISNWLNTKSWIEEGRYYNGRPSNEILSSLSDFVIGPDSIVSANPA